MQTRSQEQNCPKMKIAIRWRSRAGCHRDRCKRTYRPLYYPPQEVWDKDSGGLWRCNPSLAVLSWTHGTVTRSNSSDTRLVTKRRPELHSHGSSKVETIHCCSLAAFKVQMLVPPPPPLISSLRFRYLHKLHIKRGMSLQRLQGLTPDEALELY